MKKMMLLAVLIMVQVVQANWIENFDSYLVNQSYWSGEYVPGVPWTNVSNPVKWGRIQTWTIGSNTSGKFLGVGYNSVTYSRAIGTIGATDTVELTAQVANYHATATTGHSSWPLAGHVVLGGVALGIGGDDICYQILNGPIPTTTISNTTVTRVAPVLFKTWYDVKIVYHQIAGVNNDIADMYYKLSTSSTWTPILTGVATGQDIGTYGSNVYIKSYGQEYLSAIDNMVLMVPEPATMVVLGIGGLIMIRKRK